MKFPGAVSLTGNLVSIPVGAQLWGWGGKYRICDQRNSLYGLRLAGLGSEAALDLCGGCDLTPDLTHLCFHTSSESDQVGISPFI